MNNILKYLGLILIGIGISGACIPTGKKRKTYEPNPIAIKDYRTSKMHYKIITTPYGGVCTINITRDSLICLNQ